QGQLHRPGHAGRIARVHAAGDVGRADVFHQLIIGAQIPPAVAFTEVAVDRDAHGPTTFLSQEFLVKVRSETNSRRPGTFLPGHAPSVPTRAFRALGGRRVRNRRRVKSPSVDERNGHGGGEVPLETTGGPRRLRWKG